MQRELALLAKLEKHPEKLIQGLRLLQREFGAISGEGARAAAEYFGRTLSDVEGLIAFYPQFRRSRDGRTVIEVCGGRACGKKANPLLRDLEKFSRERYEVKSVDCLGLCAQAPAMRVNGKLYSRVDRKKLSEILACKEKTE